MHAVSAAQHSKSQVLKICWLEIVLFPSSEESLEAGGIKTNHVPLQLTTVDCTLL